MNEYIAELSNLFSFDGLTNALNQRSWLEIAFILSPSVVLIFLLFGYTGFLKTKLWQLTIYIICFVLVAAYMPFELMRQSTEMSRAQANVDEMRNTLQEFMEAANLEYVNTLNNEEVAAGMLDELLNGLSAKQKKELIMISWLMAENEKQALGQIDDKQKLLADDIKTSVSTAKSEIIGSREPAEKISGDVVKKLETDVNHLLEERMSAFKQEVDKALDSFESDINSFIQVELDNYGEKLTAITQQNVDELKDYSSKVSRSIAYQVNKINQESLQRLDDTKVSIDGIGAAINNIDLQAVANQIKQLSSTVEKSQKKNDILFEYNECMRTTGMLDLGGKKDECREKLDGALGGL